MLICWLYKCKQIIITVLFSGFIQGNLRCLGTTWFNSGKFHCFGTNCQMSQNTHFWCYFFWIKCSSVLFFMLLSSLFERRGRGGPVYGYSRFITWKEKGFKSKQQICTKRPTPHRNTCLCNWVISGFCMKVDKEGDSGEMGKSAVSNHCVADRRRKEG